MKRFIFALALVLFASIAISSCIEHYPKDDNEAMAALDSLFDTVTDTIAVDSIAPEVVK